MEKISAGNMKRASSRENLGLQSKVPQSERISRSTSHLAQLVNDKVSLEFFICHHKQRRLVHVTEAFVFGRIIALFIFLFVSLSIKFIV